MKLEDEIQVIFDDEFNTHPHPDDEIKAIEKIKSLIERYCNKQKKLCAGRFPLTQDPTTILTILETKLATEE